MSWLSKGDAILGTSDQLYLGWSAALNSDGTILALGANSGTMLAKMYRYDNSAWVTYGTNNGIISVPNNNVVNCISLNSSGNTVAIEVNNTSYTYIYRIDNSNVWVQIGSIYTQYQSTIDNRGPGRRVSLSNDGNSVAIGEPRWPGGSGSGATERRGRASVWTYDSGTTWTQKGQYILGEYNFPVNYQEWLGGSVALSGNGNFLVVGSSRYRESINIGLTGCFTFYQYSGTSWNQVGDKIYNTGGQNFGQYVSINAATNLNNVVVAMSSNGPAAVYKYSASSLSKWEQLGTNIPGGYCSQINSSGDKIVVIDIINARSPINSYYYNNTNWTKYSNTIENLNSVSMIALNNEQSSLVVGQPWYYSNGNTNPSPNPVNYTRYGLINAYQFLTTPTITNVPSSQSVPYNQAPYQLEPSSNSPAPFIYSSSNSAIASVTNAGLVSYNNIGNASITISQNSTNEYTSASTTMNVTVTKIPTNISVVTPINKIYGDIPFNLNATSNSPAIISYSSSNTNIVTVSLDGLVTILQASSEPVQIYISQPQNEYYTSASTSVTIYIAKQSTIINCQSIISVIYDSSGSQIFPFPCTSNNPEPFVYTIIDPSNNVATLDYSNNIVILGVGQASYTITQVANIDYTSGEYNGVIQVTAPITNGVELISSLSESTSQTFLIQNSISLDQTQVPLTANTKKNLVSDNFITITLD
jgi:hypothetical protein